MMRFGIVVFVLAIVGSPVTGGARQGTPADVPNKGETRT